jgi:uncharacterized protein (TIGR02599 family)
LSTAFLQRSAFTLVELLASTAVIAVLLLVLVSAVSQTGATLRMTTSKTEEFREARTAFETVTRRLSEATLNTYWDYDNPTAPKRYERRSELRFVCGPAASLLGDTGKAARVSHAIFFHAPLGLTEPVPVPTADQPDFRGLENLLNVWGYFVELSDDRAQRPTFLTDAIRPPRHRFRLMECMQPTEKLRTYNYTSGGTATAPASISYKGLNWFTDFINLPDAPVHPLAENIVALILTPRLSKVEESAFNLGADASPLAPKYSYDSTQTNAEPRLNPKNQLPPVVQVTMVAIDEASASRLNLGPKSADLFRLNGKFTESKYFTRDLTLDPTRGPEDSLENRLIDLKAGYRVFSTHVPIRAAKWSREQTN